MFTNEELENEYHDWKKEQDKWGQLGGNRSPLDTIFRVSRGVYENFDDSAARDNLFETRYRKERNAERYGIPSWALNDDESWWNFLSSLTYTGYDDLNEEGLHESMEKYRDLPDNRLSLPNISAAYRDGPLFEDDPEELEKRLAEARIIEEDRKNPSGRLNVFDTLRYAARNLPASTAGVAGDIGAAVRHPVDTALTLGKIPIGLGMKIVDWDSVWGAGQSMRETAEGAIDHFVNRYGSPSALVRTGRSDPMGVPCDFSLLGGAASLAAKYAGRVLSAAAIAGAGNVFSKYGQKLGNGAAAVDPLNIPAWGIEKIAGKVGLPSNAEQLAMYGGFARQGVSIGGTASSIENSILNAPGQVPAPRPQIMERDAQNPQNAEPYGDSVGQWPYPPFAYDSQELRASTLPNMAPPSLAPFFAPPRPEQPPMVPEYEPARNLHSLFADLRAAAQKPKFGGMLAFF